MNIENHHTSLYFDSDTVIEQFTQHLTSSGLRVVRSFDLQSACASMPDQPCPHHRDAPCDCQMVVLLVYGEGCSPASLVLHSHRGVTDIDLVESPNNQPDKELVEIIHSAFKAILNTVVFQRERTESINLGKEGVS
jgi:hypothetical protein